MTDPAMTVAGRALAAPGSFDVVNPATGEVFAQAPACGPDQLDQAMAAAQSAFDTWRTDEKARVTALHAMADALEQSADALARLLTTEQGKPLPEAANEIRVAGIWLRYFAGLSIPRETIEAGGVFEVVRRPLGVVAAIAPWNFPITLATWKIAPALRAGNTVVLKPSPFTPLTTLAMGELMREVLPPGVLNVVTGPDPLGAWMTAHPVPRKISFTGSTATGKKVAAAAADDLKRITLELGGNDPAIVLPDADPAAIAHRLFWDAFVNNGQYCLAVKRVYVHESRHDELVGALAAEANNARIGNGLDTGVQLGPLNNRPQLDRIVELVADAVAHGAVVAAGGERLDGPGYFHRPTILTNVAEGMRIVDEEQFGPALPVIAYQDVDDAVRQANATDYGLSASVWSPDLDRAADVAARLECGQVSLNAHAGALRPNLPFGGHKWSGVGVENGPWGLDSYSSLQVIAR